MATPNINKPDLIVNLTEVGASGIAADSGAFTSLLNNAASSGLVYDLDTLTIANRDTVAHTVSAYIYKANATVIYLGFKVPVGIGGTAVFPAAGHRLNENDTLFVACDTVSKADALCGYKSYQ